MIVDMTTGNPSETRAMAGELTPRGITLIDAPVSGGPRGAREGTIAIMVGGGADAFDVSRRAAAVLHAAAERQMAERRWQVRGFQEIPQHRALRRIDHHPDVLRAERIRPPTEDRGIVQVGAGAVHRDEVLEAPGFAHFTAEHHLFVERAHPVVLAAQETNDAQVHGPAQRSEGSGEGRILAGKSLGAQDGHPPAFQRLRDAGDAGCRRTEYRMRGAVVLLVRDRVEKIVVLRQIPAVGTHRARVVDAEPAQRQPVAREEPLQARAAGLVHADVQDQTRLSGHGEMDVRASRRGPPRAWPRHNCGDARPTSVFRAGKRSGAQTWRNTRPVREGV